DGWSTAVSLSAEQNDRGSGWAWTTSAFTRLRALRRLVLRHADHALRREPLADCRLVRLRLLDERHVRGLLDDHQLGARHLAVDLLGLGDRARPLEAAGQDQHRLGDPAQVVDPLEVAVAVGGEVPEHL